MTANQLVPWKSANAAQVLIIHYPEIKRRVYHPAWKSHPRIPTLGRQGFLRKDPTSFSDSETSAASTGGSTLPGVQPSTEEDSDFVLTLAAGADAAAPGAKSTAAGEASAAAGMEPATAGVYSAVVKGISSAAGDSDLMRTGAAAISAATPAAVDGLAASHSWRVLSAKFLGQSLAMLHPTGAKP